MDVSDQEEAGRNLTPPAQPDGPPANGVPEEPQGGHGGHGNCHILLQCLRWDVNNALLPPAVASG